MMKMAFFRTSSSADSTSAKGPINAYDNLPRAHSRAGRSIDTIDAITRLITSPTVFQRKLGYDLCACSANLRREEGTTRLDPMLLATKLLRVGYPCHVSMALEGVQGLPQGPYIIMETLDAEAAGAELVIVIGFREHFGATCPDELAALLPDTFWGTATQLAELIALLQGSDAAAVHAAGPAAQPAAASRSSGSNLLRAIISFFQGHKGKSRERLRKIRDLDLLPAAKMAAQKQAQRAPGKRVSISVSCSEGPVTHMQGISA